MFAENWIVNYNVKLYARYIKPLAHDGFLPICLIFYITSSQLDLDFLL